MVKSNGMFTIRGAQITAYSASPGGLLSVALSRALRPVDVIHHHVLWSPDFPPAKNMRPNRAVKWPRPSLRPGVQRAIDAIFSRRSPGPLPNQ